jgi:L-ascorbate metabolism protein UlaG (beta-lactamase superfamily)
VPTPWYLKQNVKVEPLVDQWYAWSHLLAPLTAARNVTHRHLRIMDSYIENPQLHAAAIRDRRMLGGPFIDYDGGRVDAIRALRDRTLAQRGVQLELSAAIDQLDALLSEAVGGSLEELYARVPPPLRGYVELVYDLRNQPGWRPFEALLYRSRFHDRSLWTLMLSTISADDRPFALSTPRLESEDALHWKVPFHDERVDALFRCKSQPQPLATIREWFADCPCRDRLLERLLTQTPPPAYQPYHGATVRWRYFGHACVLVEFGRTSVLVDPVLSYTYESQISRYTYLDLPDRIDYVLITHNHQDHILFETLLQLRHKVRHVIVPFGGGSLQDPSLRLMLEQAGFDNVIEVRELDEVAIDQVRIIALPFLGEHSDLDIRTKNAYLMGVDGRKILFAADSRAVEPRLYEHLHREYGDVDALFLGMECNGAPLTWLYGPLLSTPIDRRHDQARRLAGSTFEHAKAIIDALHCREVYVYAMGQEPWLDYVMSIKYTERSKPIVESNRLLEECRQRGIRAERLFGEREMFLN